MITLFHDTDVVVFVQSLNRVRLFVTPWTAKLQAPLSSTISQSLFNFMSIESVMLLTASSSSAPFFYCLQFFPASGSFPMLFASGSQSIGASALATVLPVNIHGWFPLELIGLTSLLSKGLKSLLHHHISKASILQRSAFFMVQLSHPATGLEKVHFHSNPRERQCQRMFKLLHNCSHFTCC